MIDCYQIIKYQRISLDELVKQKTELIFNNRSSKSSKIFFKAFVQYFSVFCIKKTRVQYYALLFFCCFLMHSDRQNAIFRLNI